MAFQKIKIVVSQRDETKDNKFKPVGDIEIFVPLLADIMPFVGSPVKLDEKGQPVLDDGIPVYVSDEANWIQGAMLAAVKASARNKLVPKTATLKPDNKIPTDWAELTAESDRNPGAALQLDREFKAAFGEWVLKQGISEAATATLTTLVGNRAALSLQQQATKDKVKARLEGFAEAIDADTLEKFQRPLTRAMEACDAAKAEDAMDF